MFELGTWVKSSGVAPELYQGLVGRIVQSEDGELHYMHSGKLGYWVMYMERRKFITKGLPATWIEETTQPEGEALIPWMLQIMKS